MAEPTHTPDVNPDGTIGAHADRHPEGKTRPDAPNISTEHREKGDAIAMSDTLDRDPEAVHPAREFDPVEDVGKSEPGKE